LRQHAECTGHLKLFGATLMNWLVIAVVGAAAAWFEYNYQRSRHAKKSATNASPPSSGPQIQNTASPPVPQAAQVAKAGNEPSISPGDENDQKLNSPDAGMKAYSMHTQL